MTNTPAKKYIRRQYDAAMGMSSEDCDPAPPVLATPFGNMMGSLVDGVTHQQYSLHLPCIDIDHPIRAIPSETPGHFHLMVDVPIRWDAYVKLLEALRDCGLVEPGYVASALHHGQSFVATKPWKGV